MPFTPAYQISYYLLVMIILHWKPLWINTKGDPKGQSFCWVHTKYDTFKSQHYYGTFGGHWSVEK